MQLATERLQVRLLGQAEFVWCGQTLSPESKKGVALLSYLALLEHGATRIDLAELLWGSAEKNRNLNTEISALRKLPGHETWLIEDSKKERVQVNAETDVAIFEKLLHETKVEDALALWRGPFLDGYVLRKSFPLAEELESIRSRLNTLYDDACANVLARSTDFATVKALAQRRLADDPQDQQAFRGLVRAVLGQQGLESALEYVGQFVQRLEAANEDLEEETLELIASLEDGTASKNPVASVLHRSNANQSLPAPDKLFGRQEMLAKIEHLLYEGKQVLVHGFGGTGKTALAATVAQTWLERGSVLWLEVGNESPEAILNALAQALQQSPIPNSTEQKVEVIRKLLTEQDISLVVLDNVWNFLSLRKIMEVLPPETSLLVTSRQRYPQLRDRIVLGRLERPAALDLLHHHAEREVDAKDADALCELLGDLALAIRIAGLTLHQQNIPVEELLEKIRDVPHVLRTDGDVSVSALLETSLAFLEDEPYETFLAFGGLFVPSATPELLANCLRRDREVVEGALYTLLQHGLVDRSAPRGSDIVVYSQHDLAFSYAKTRSIIRPRTVIQASVSYLDNHKSDLRATELELGNLLGAANEAAQMQESKALVSIMRSLAVDGVCYTARGHTSQSVELLEQAIRRAKELNDLDSTHELLAKLGYYYNYTIGDFGMAFSTYQEASEIAKFVDAWGRAASYLSDCGVALCKQKRGEANHYLQMSYDLARKKGDDLSLCIVLEHWGYVLAEQQTQDFQLANKLFRESLAVVNNLEKAGALTPNEIARRRFFALINLAESEQDLGQIQSALKTKKLAWLVAKQNDNSIWKAHVFYDLGVIQHKIGKSKYAQRYLARALKLYQQNQMKTYIDQIRGYMQENNYLI